MAKSKWNYDTCLEESRKYKSRSEFSRKCSHAYHVALKNKWLDDCIFEEGRQSWDKESCLEEARKYTSRGEFQRKCSRAYPVARVNGWLDGHDWFEQKLFYKEDK